MKAARIHEYGDSSIITIEDIDIPTPQPGKVLIKVLASSLNPFDTTIRRGHMKEFIPLELPITLGGDIAGVITELGEGVEGFNVGDKVYGQANVVAGNSGAFAEFAATKATQIGLSPKNLSVPEAAAVPLVGVSALQALTEHIKLQPNQKLFIHGGAGGIGRIAIQIAKHIGAYVATTATGDGIEDVTQLGADEVIDYKTENFADILSEYDAVFDTVGGEDFSKSLGILKKGGIAVSMIGTPDEAQAEALGVSAFQQSTHVTTEALDNLRELIEDNVIKIQIGKQFTLDEVQEAFTARESGSVQGKIVLSIGE